ncbi:Cytochrome P450 monooxygenase patH [Colletotrichum siamense]|nr:Cytochrome P450 monooxygenase patH [Colletotrichum siamense]
MRLLSPKTILPSQAVGTFVFILLLAWLVRKFVKVIQFKKRYRLPNPVPGLPLIGNAHQIPRDLPYLFFQDLAKKYGEMFTINIGGTNWLFLNSKRTVNELLEKRAAIYSSRMNLPMAYDLVSRGKRTLLMPYGDLWRRERKVMHQILNATQRNIFEPFQDLESKALLLNYLERPDEWWKSHGAFSGSVIMSVVFGRRAGVDDANLSDSLAVSEEFVEYLMPGRAIVDHFPFLADIPWFKSLQPWRWYGDDLYKRTRAVYKRELDQLRERRAQGKQRDCFMTEFLEKEHDSDFTEDEFLFMAGALMEAGTDTTRASLDQCVAAAALWPGWIERAREQLDEVCGANAQRLPTAQDMPNLPIIKGAVKESVRWKPTIAETGIPHALMRDDEFEGYKIPAGTIVTYNQWAIANSADEYEQPERFWPERFINEYLDKPAKGHLGFGAVYCFDVLPVPGAKIDTSQSPKVTKHGPSFQVKIKVRNWALGIPDTWEITTADLRTFNDVRYILKSEPDASHALASFYFEYSEFCASAPMPMVDALLGNESYWSSREAFEQLRSWAGTQQARRATWHSGQILRAVRLLSPKDRADFHGFACYQAMLSLWVYSLYQTCPASMTGGEAQSAEDELRIQIDGEETIKSQRWISYGNGKPCISRSVGSIGNDCRSTNDIFAGMKSSEGEEELLVSALDRVRSLFASEVTGRQFPILKHTCRILQALGAFKRD